MLPIYLALLETEEEKQKFELIYEKYRKLMHWIAKGILHDDSLAEDAVHEAFLRILKNLDKINKISCPQTKNFTVIIVRNVALGMLAEEKKRRERESSIAQDSEEDGERSWNEYFENLSSGLDETPAEVLKSELIDMILSLPDWAKETIFLSAYYGMSTAEIGVAEGITTENAKKRLQRSRKLLAEKLGKGERK